nr:integrase, catalytic region, zinc finger, CCHC-type, peptidase aspartic, catalytic [Tanacetum cinerariifolium]
MRILLLYRGEYSQWRERFMNYLEEKTDGEEMINYIQNGDHPFPIVAQVSLVGTAPNVIPTLKDPNNKTAKDLWNALERQMRGSEYGEQDRKAAILYEYETFKATKREQLLDTYLRYLQVINDLKKCGYKKDNCELNYKFLNNLQPEWKQYALVAEKTKVSKRKEKVEIQTESERSDDDDISDLKKITALLTKAFNRKKFYAKPTNNNLRTSSASSSANKKQEYVKSVEKKEDKKVDEKKRDMSKDQAWMESNSDSDQEINANMVFMAKIEKVLSDSDESFSSAKETIAEVAYYTSESESESEYETLEYYDNSTNYGLFVNDNEDQEIFHDAIKSASENFIENHIDSQKDYDKSEVDHNDSEKKDHLVDKLIRKFNHKIAKFQKRIEKANQQTKDLEIQNKDLHEKYDVLINQVIGLGYTPMFLIYLDEAFEIEKFKRARENKIEFAYDYGNLNASYVNEKINFSDDYFQEIINLDFEKIDSPFQQTSSLKPYVSSVSLEKIIIDLEGKVVSLLEKQKANLKIIESLKSKGFELSEIEISESENQSENDCHVVEKECDKVENSKVIAPGLFKLNLDTFGSVRRPKHSDVIWKKKGLSNSSNIGLSAVSVSNLNKNVKRYSRKDLLSCNNSHLGETSSAYVCNNDMNVSCNSRMCDFLDKNNLFIFDDESVRISPVSKMPFGKKPRVSMNVHSKSNSNKSLPRTVHRWLLKMQRLAEPIAKWIPIICLWIIDSGCSKHMTGNRALLTNFVEKFLGTVRFGNNYFVVIAGYGDVVIGSMTIKKVYCVEEIINPDFEKIDSLFLQTSLLKPYVPTVILEKIIIDLVDEGVGLLEKEKANMETIESLKSKGFESSENAISESENQSENDRQVVEKECQKVVNSKLIAPGVFKLNCPDLSLDHRFGMFKAYDGNRALLTNFVEKFLGTVHFGNNDFAVIAGYGDVVIGSMTIKKVYYVKGLGHNLFSVGQFCDKGLEVAFRKSTCFVRNEDGVDLLTSDRSLNLYTIALNEVALNSSTCLIAKASSS